MAPHALADSAPERYNLRVVEVLCASRLLLHAWGVDAAKGVSGEQGRIWLRQALEMLGRQGSDAEVYQHALDAVPSVLGVHPQGWTRDDMVQASGLPADDFEKTYLDFVPVRAERFQLAKRAQHTFEESLRVPRFTALCEGAGSPDVAKELGDLLNASHISLRDLFDATVPEVENLRDLCLANGALGSRQTGGGWGGAVISLLPVDEVPGFLERITQQYEPFTKLSSEQLKDAAFATLPGCGAGIYAIDGDVN
jgi:galactokinase